MSALSVGREASPFRCSSGPKVTTSTYNVPLVDLAITCVVTHDRARSSAYRSAGRQNNLLDLERLMEHGRASQIWHRSGTSCAAATS